MNLQYKVSNSTSQYLQPNGDGNVDVVKDFDWTLTPKSGRSNVPRAYVKEYQQTAGQLVASLLYISKLGLEGATTVTGNLNADQLYRYKYIAKETGFTYIFPYFNTKKHTRSTSFEPEKGHEMFGSLTKFGRALTSGHQPKHGGFLSTIGSYMYKGSVAVQTGIDVINKMIPGEFNLDLPHAWHGTTEGEYTISFDLFNTGTEESMKNNRNLCYILAYQNTQSRRNAMITDPVCIYEVKIGDVVYMPAACMSNLEITNLGNTTSMAFDGVKKIIPEAYRINMTFSSLLQPSRQIMNGLDTGQTVQAIDSPEDLAAAKQNALKLISPVGSPVNPSTSDPFSSK